jgi:hypothetical protein
MPRCMRCQSRSWCRPSSGRCPRCRARPPGHTTVWTRQEIWWNIINIWLINIWLEIMLDMDLDEQSGWIWLDSDRWYGSW